MNKYYSQYNQDKFVNEVIFAGQKNGFFIDIGAHDGISLSNSYFFEILKDWDGICFEPNPEIFEKLKENRTCSVVNKCVGDLNSEISFCKVIGPSNMLSGILAQYNELHLKRIESEVSLNGGSFEIITVQMVKLRQYLQEGKIVNFLSIDTEGNELSILESIDFDRNHFVLISVENNYGDSSIKKFLNKKSFVFLTRLGTDDVYLNQSDLIAPIIFRTTMWILQRKIKNGLKKLHKIFYD